MVAQAVARFLIPTFLGHGAKVAIGDWNEASGQALASELKESGSTLPHLPTSHPNNNTKTTRIAQPRPLPQMRRLLLVRRPRPLPSRARRLRPPRRRAQQRGHQPRGLPRRQFRLGDG